ncbi:MAG: lipopolysaccharide heptosyltransferase II [Deltaproteobacteria bacterium]|nr:lipopolysaccharide heptosyltransferase II [Deltaproteobacteria bacterium]MBW2601331.1 lipopolysaccharide heptosyltransferase II [Deltaproteobacteria bacterium]
MKSKTILVFCPNWVGDVVMATPAFDCLRANYRDARLVAIIRRYVQGVVDDGPWFDQVIGCNDKSFRGFLELIRKVRRLGPDISIVMPNSFRAALSAWLGGSRGIYGYRRNCRSLLLTGGPKPLAGESGFVPIPMVEYYMAICRWLGLDIPVSRRPSLFVSDRMEQKAERLLGRYGIKAGDTVIGMNPGARFGSSKCWPPEHFAALAEQLNDQWDCRILLFVGPGEENIAQSIVKASKAPIINTAPDKVDLALLKPLVKRCRLLITNDTGPRHYAVAFSIPVVVIMGPTDPRYTAANLEKTIVLQRQLACIPCHEKVCRYNHECMTLIDSQAVLEACQTFLQGSA